MARLRAHGMRKDANHQQVIGWFEALGCRVKDVSMVPGFVDIVVKCCGQVRLIEIKDGAKSSSRKQLTRPEQDFWDDLGRGAANRRDAAGRH